MQLSLTDKQRALRLEYREWLLAHIPRSRLPSMDTLQGFEAHRQWERALHEGRWSCLTWPNAWAGRDCSLIEWFILEEAYWAAGAPRRVNQNGIFLLGDALLKFGSASLQAQHLPRIASGEAVWAQGWSEPAAGSDVAAVRCLAERQGDHYVINGQKSWVARGVWADGLFGLFRTERNALRHQGLSVLLVPLRADGVTIRPIRQLNGRTGMAHVEFRDVRVPVDQRLGAEGAGWRISLALSSFERGMMLRSPARFQETARALLKLYQANHKTLERDASIRDAVVRCAMQARAYALTAYHAACGRLAGMPASVDGSSAKLFWSELDLRMHETALRILNEREEGPHRGPHGLETDDAAHWLDGFLFAQAGSIYAGTSEVHRNIVAERSLGLPR